MGARKKSKTLRRSCSENKMSIARLERLTVEEFAERNIVLPSAYAAPGAFKVGFSQYLTGPWEALCDPEVREVTVLKATQTGGSLVADIFFAYLIRNCPAPTFLNMQTDDDAKNHTELRINELLNNCAPVFSLLPEGHKGKLKRVTQEIITQVMWAIMQGANLSNLQSKSVCISFNDEIVFWKPDSLLRDAYARQTAFGWQRKTYNCSQGGMVGDEMDRRWKGGTMETYAWTCPKCEFVQPYKWSYNNNFKDKGGIKFEKSDLTCPDGKWDYEALAQTVRMQCRECEHDLEDTPKVRRMLADGSAYIRQNPSAPRSRRSFNWNALACEAIPWADIVWEWVNEVVPEYKQGNREPLQKFIQKKLAEADDEGVNWFDVQKIESSDYAFDENGNVPQWDDEAFRFMAIDKQIDHYWYVVRAFSKVGTSRLVAYGRAESDKELELIRESFGVETQYTAIDSGHWASDVYMYCCIYGWRTLKGDNAQGFPHKDERGEKVWRPYSEPVNREPLFGFKGADMETSKVQEFQRRRKYRYAKLCRWSNPMIKDILFNLRAGMGIYWGVPANVGQVYIDQMNGEQRRIKIDNKGKRQWIWVKTGRAGDHLRDCECMILVQAALRGLLIGRPT